MNTEEQLPLCCNNCFEKNIKPNRFAVLDELVNHYQYFHHLSSEKISKFIDSYTFNYN